MLPRYYILLYILFLVSCSPIKVNTIYDERYKFHELDSFCWMNGCEFNIDGPEYLSGDTVVVSSFMKQIKNLLMEKGFSYSSESPDFVINLHVVAFEKEVKGYTPYHIYGNENDFTPLMEEETYQYLEGSLIIDIADYHTSRVVWRSDVVGYTDSGTAFRENTIKKVIRKALNDFPPK